ncbi:DNA replication/repair protein RecF [Thalassotalea atypica]|uniref:DNA replication/repair protein RecF n=1 Tax=Thalassotalea atypica TaxID=2054316 RepID=UPI0025740B5F|nr:DNA replication/repair protein RecF [Thalassotalea atypica]
MALERLYTKNFRNLNEQAIDFNSELNFIIGDNGSGKSSLLEALFFIGHGKSFRTTKSDNLVTIGKDVFFVNTKDSEGNTLGVSKQVSEAAFSIKINGEKRHRLSELAKTLAIQVITPESFKLFFGGAKERRKFLDLGLFHVEHSFQQYWKTFSKLLKQRNACLRNQDQNEHIAYWTEQFCIASIHLNEFRSQYSQQLKVELSKWLKILLPKVSDSIEIQYYRGWNQKKSLAEVLDEARDKELKQGYSQAGPQKFDFRFLIEKQPLDLKLSRGQQKLFLLALTFAQSKLMKRVTPVKPILLIDDVGAELDDISRTLLATSIKELGCQVVMTAIDVAALEPMILEDNNYKMFHVEHGEISETNRL